MRCASPAQDLSLRYPDVEAPMNTINFDKLLVRNILEHANDYCWSMQDIGLLGLRLDEQREYRLHVWSPDSAI
jgi:hypothetical protein